jgi:hypothetical protein
MYPSKITIVQFLCTFSTYSTNLFRCFLKHQSNICTLIGKYYEHLNGIANKNCIQNKNLPAGDILSGFYNVCKKDVQDGLDDEIQKYLNLFAYEL